jgi:hypothetical protein
MKEKIETSKNLHCFRRNTLQFGSLRFPISGCNGAEIITHALPKKKQIDDFPIKGLESCEKSKTTAKEKEKLE